MDLVGGLVARVRSRLRMMVWILFDRCLVLRIMGWVGWCWGWLMEGCWCWMMVESCWRWMMLMVLWCFGGLVVDHCGRFVRNKLIVGGLCVKAVRLDRGVERKGDGEDVVVGDQLHLVVAVLGLQVGWLEAWWVWRGGWRRQIGL